MDWYWPDQVDLPGYKPNTKGHPKQIKEAARSSSSRSARSSTPAAASSRPAAEALRELAELTGIHVVTTLMARGVPRRPPTCAWACRACTATTPPSRRCREADLLIALGPRFDDRVTGKVDAFAPDAKIIHVDIDPAELGQGAPARRADRRRLPPRDRGAGQGEGRLDERRAHPTARRWKQIAAAGRSATRSPTSSPTGDALKPQYVLEQLRDNTPDDTIVVSGVGQHQMWTSQYWKFNHPYTWVNSGGLGTMGFAVPAAIGAKVGRPDRMVWAVDGDGCFQMTAQELVTASAERIPVKVAILNNAYLGMVRQWQELFYEERYSEVYLSPDLPDYVKWAEAMGCVGIRVDSPEEVSPPSRRPTRSTTARWSSTSAPTPGRRCTRWSRPAPPTTTSSSIPAQGEGGRSRTAEPSQHHILSVLVENKSGVLARVAGLFARRGLQHRRSRSARPRTSASAASRSSSTPSRRRSSRSPSSSTSSSP